MSILDTVSGRIIDTDNHEYFPAHMWAEHFGEASKPIAEFFMREHDPNALSSYSAPVYEDEGPVSRELIEKGWGTNRPPVGAIAPGAFNMRRRVDVMDTYGVDQTLLFAGGPGVIGYMFIQVPERVGQLMGDVNMTHEQLLECGRSMLIGYNDWCIETAKISPRLRPVAFIDTTDLELAIAEIDRVAANGIRAVAIPQGLPPGGISPGHPDADPLWTPSFATTCRYCSTPAATTESSARRPGVTMGATTAQPQRRWTAPKVCSIRGSGPSCIWVPRPSSQR